ncbi:MAG TPA: pteridine-dependent deoxygenase [Thermoanaerobaculia bacterium]|nr:pteridine-dependent deoxygenase [Thermoanaerobaculia bacterium]
MQPSGDGIAPVGWSQPAAVSQSGRASKGRGFGMALAPASAPETALTPFAAILHAGGADALPGTPLVVRVPLPQLSGEPLAELWQTPGPVTSGLSGSVRWAAAGPLLAGALELPARDAGALEAAACFAYRELLALSAERGFPHLLRLWNVVPGINRLEAGLERYRRFCRGRAEAFEGHHGPLFQSRLCASSAVGSTGEELVTWFLACRERGVARENPRQVSAYSYPPCYGPRSPSFARATRCPATGGGWLLLSGTASIVGHRSVHPGDVRRQLEETLRNLEELLPAETGVRFHGLKVYLRHARDLATVRDAIEARLGTELPVLYVQADICREELLLEIEGVA